MIDEVRAELQKVAVESAKEKKAAFFKTGPGEYAEGDLFIGVTVPNVRKIARLHRGLPLTEIQKLLESKVNEERLLALLILVDQYQKAKGEAKKPFYRFYVKNLRHVNHWNLVDASAHLIVGAHLIDQDKSFLFKLAQSEVLWERRVAIVSTWYFIRKQQVEWTYQISEVLLNDPHDLIHKAVGWMLREAGKKDENKLIIFLESFANRMPRTMLRYAIEKFPKDVRMQFLNKK